MDRFSALGVSRLPAKIEVLIFMASSVLHRAISVSGSRLYFVLFMPLLENA